MARPALAILAAGLGGLLLASSAFAATVSDAPSVRVSYSELDLTRDAGIERLYARLRHAAAEVCGSADIRDLGALARQESCARQALDRAVEDVHSARLTARHKGGAVGLQYARLSRNP
jgi:UrcA family protein